MSKVTGVEEALTAIRAMAKTLKLKLVERGEETYQLVPKRYEILIMVDDYVMQVHKTKVGWEVGVYILEGRKPLKPILSKPEGRHYQCTVLDDKVINNPELSPEEQCRRMKLVGPDENRPSTFQRLPPKVHPKPGKPPRPPGDWLPSEGETDAGWQQP